MTTVLPSWRARSATVPTGSCRGVPRVGRLDPWSSALRTMCVSGSRIFSMTLVSTLHVRAVDGDLACFPAAAARSHRARELPEGS
jgi:hypothetical protein